jgi:transcription elongation factor GreA-like protein
MLKNMIFSIILILSSNKGYTQKTISDTAALNLIEKISTHNTWESDLIGPDGDSSEQHKNFEALAKIITKEQMLSLVKNHSSRVIKCYAIIELRKTKTEIPNKVLKKIKRDKGKMETLFGCMRRKHTIASFLNL